MSTIRSSMDSSSDSSDEEFFDAPTAEDSFVLHEVASDDKRSIIVKSGDSFGNQVTASSSNTTSSHTINTSLSSSSSTTVPYSSSTSTSAVLLSSVTSASSSSSVIPSSSLSNVATSATVTPTITTAPSTSVNPSASLPSSTTSNNNETSEANCDQDRQITSTDTSSGLPKPPPRRKRKPTITITKSDATPNNNGDHTSEGSAVKNVNTCLTTLVDEIASIQGDLSVNHDFPLRVASGQFGSSEDLSSLASDQQSDKDESPDVTLREDANTSVETSSPESSKTPVNSESSEPLHLQSKSDDLLEQQEDLQPYPPSASQHPQKQSIDKQPDQGVIDEETKILEQITLLNKDTGECRPLSQADDILPKCINPLNPHLSKLVNDYQSDEDESQPQTSEGPVIEEGYEPGSTLKTSAFKNGVKKLGKFGHGFIKGVKGVRGGGSSNSGDIGGSGSSDGKFNRDSVSIDPRVLNLDPHDLMYPMFKLKTNRKKDAADFEGLRVIQELNDCRGAIWCMKWSSCGQLLAVAGQDQLLRVYCSHKSWKYFTQARSKASSQQISPNSTKERSVNNSRNNSISSSENVHNLSSHSDSRSRNNLQQEDNSLSEEGPLLLFSAYRGHTADVLDISWSKNNFLLSSSMDKTVKLWHITRVECLCTFCHKDFVTTINFHPRDDRYFLSGSLDGVLRLWNIPDKRLTLFNEVMAPTASSQKSSNKSNQETTPPHGLITASAFVENGKFAVIGTYDGRVIFYSTDQLKYSTQIHVSGGKNVSSSTDTSERKKKRNSNKVTGIEGVAERKILVTTNDSRIRLYDLRDLTLECKYKGCVNYSSQIRASVSPDNKYIVCGSENSSFYIWRTREETTTGQRRDRNAQWECVRLLPPSNQAQQVGLSSNTVGSGQPSKNQPAIVTSATFAPNPSYLDDKAKYVLAIADFTGSIKVFSRQ